MEKKYQNQSRTGKERPGGGARRRQGERPLEVWGGIECSITRVGDDFYDQLERGGHKVRLEDLDRIAALGIKALRYPVLWEAHYGGGADWSWAEERLGKLRDLGIEPIVGLVHHGSGPPHTSLLDPAFAEGLAGHAAEVARRFPWVKYFTPVNEPLTTARFSCLYGHWYPHERHPAKFLRALIVQVQATIAAMQAIREKIPDAQLVQTEDMGFTSGTRALAHQAQFDNGRRWLSLDLLCGRLTPEHVFWNHFLEHGVQADELLAIAANACPPNIIGINHYITSERFLDERLEHYPPESHGGNGRQAYADVPAVRVCKEGPLGPYAILRSAWERYKLPLAVTEAHLGCTREEQLRWLMEVWGSARKLREEGVDIRAVTSWSLLGARDWNTLLTQRNGYYESGAFDERSDPPRATAVARCVAALAKNGHYAHPVLATPGWWRRDERLIFPITCTRRGTGEKLGWRALRRILKQPEKARPILITGATGTLGNAFRRIAEQRGLAYRIVSREEMDITSARSVSLMLEAVRPWAVINAAGFVRVDDAENDFERCFRENAWGAELLAQACARRGVGLVTFSSDLVFDGEKQRAYLESDVPNPLNVYGRSKREAEQKVLRHLPGALVVRTSAFFGPWDKWNFATQVCQKLRAGEPMEVLSDAVVSPTYVPDLVNATLDLLLDGERGIWHLANQGEITWSEFARKIAELDELPGRLLRPRALDELDLPARRPRFCALASERGQIMPSLEDALGRYLRERDALELPETARV